MVTREKLIEIVKESGLTASEFVKRSEGFVSLNQACQWVKFWEKSRKLSNPVMYMLWRISSDILKEKEFSVKLSSIPRENDIDIGGDMVDKSKELVNLFLNGIETEIGGNSFLTNDKINVMPYCYVKKANGVYFNVDGDIYLNQGSEEMCVFNKDGKERKVKIGAGIFGKLEIIS
jgi:hypothetical protein